MTFSHAAPSVDALPANQARPRGLTLLIDADDTLWENNIYFDEVVAQYAAFVERHGGKEAEARAKLLDIERERTKRFGYGIDNFRLSLWAACDHLLQGSGYRSEITVLDELCSGLRRRAILLLPGVDETLRDLASRHRLILVTKGDHDDQLSKVTRSGLRSRFHEVDVVAEKDAPTYRELVRRHGLDPARTWMIGNSPKSDILPALEASLRAVFIPHAATWTLELMELPPVPDGRMLVIERFTDLPAHF
jgi:putative hydrolase of the HAD superfamily